MDTQIPEERGDVPPSNGFLLYHQSVIPSQQILHVVPGSFTLPNADDIVVVRPRLLELWTLNTSSARLECVHALPLFTDVYAVVAVPTGAAVLSSKSKSSGVQRDGVHYLAVTSASGCLVLLRYELLEPPIPTRVSTNDARSREGNNATVVSTSLRGVFVKVSEVMLSRSGVRVTAPGMRMTVDDGGTALFITAFMRCKVVVPIRKTNVEASELRSVDDLEESASDTEEEEEEVLVESTSSSPSARKRRREKRANGVIALSSPIDVHRQTVIYSICAIEGSAETALFAALEEEVAEAREVSSPTPSGNTFSGAFLKLPSTSPAPMRRKTLVVYSYTASLKQVQRTHLLYPPLSAHRLISLPGPPSGPGGVLVCCDTEIIWYDLSSATESAADGRSSTGVYKCSTPLPRRSDFPDTNCDPSIIGHAVTAVAGDYFLLIQDEHGDTYRVSISREGVQAAKNAYKIQKEMQSGAARMPRPEIRNPLAVLYYETIAPAKAMAIFRRGYLFAASDGGAHHWLFVVKEGYTQESDFVIKRLKSSRSAPALEKKPGGEMGTEGKKLNLPSPAGLSGITPPPLPAAQTRTIAVFQPHDKLRHLELVQQLPNTPPVASLCTRIPALPSGGDDQRQTQSTQQQQVQITSLCGRGAMSVLLQARYGYATKKLNRAVLSAVFIQIIPLTSASALREFRVLQHRLIQEAAEAQRKQSGRRRDGNSSAVNKALRKLAAMANQYRIGTDRVVLSTLTGTAVFTVGAQVEEDTLSGFDAAERTLTASTIEDGRGYIQVTPRALLVLPPSSSDGSAALQGAVEGMTWTHPSGKAITAAASSPKGAVLLFSGGGLTSFSFDDSCLRMVEMDHLPNFPPATAVSLLQPPESLLTSAIHGELNRLLHATSSSSAGDTAHSELAAVAVGGGDVHILDPCNLQKRKTLDLIRPRDRGAGSAEIHSVLLTYMDEAADSGVLLSSRRRRRGGRTRRIFCFIGYADGDVVRCEIDGISGKVTERHEFSCGAKPAQLIPGDGETTCYIQSGEQCWRCAVRAGVPKVMPLIFSSRQNAFARFSVPKRPASLRAEESGVEEEEGVSTIQLTPAAPNEEMVIALHDRDLQLFSAQHIAGGPSSLEYSFIVHPLPQAGRRLLRHPAHPSYLLLAATEHRGYSKSTVVQRGQEGSPALYVAGPRRSLNKPLQYNSSLQLFHEESNGLLPPLCLAQGEAILSMTIGCFAVDIGREPIVVVGVARDFSHGKLCGSAPEWRDGILHSFRCVPSYGSLDAEGRPLLKLEVLHHTILEDLVKEGVSDDPGHSSDYASALHICEDVGLLFVGLGAKNGLRAYTYGRNHFVFKRHLRNVPGRIIAIDTVFHAPTTGTPASSFYASGLYNCPQDNTNALRRAREKQLLIVCGTSSHSVFVAALQPGSGSVPSFLMLVARDPVPRHLTCMTLIDERTVAVADRFGSVAFLLIPATTRTTFAEPLDKLADAELNVLQEHAARQLLEEVALHHPGQLVTSMHMQDYDPSGGTDSSLATRILFYGTALGSVGCYTPFIAEEDGALAAYARPLLREHMRLALQPGSGAVPFHWNQHDGIGHNVVEGERFETFRQASSAIFSAGAKEAVEERLERIRAAQARRSRLPLPHHLGALPSLDELVAKQRALSTLPL